MPKLESSTSEEVWEGDGHGEVVWVAVQVDEVGGEQEAGGGHGEAGREHDGQGEASLLAEPGLELQTNLAMIMRSFTITEKAPTRDFFWLKAPTHY